MIRAEKIDFCELLDWFREAIRSDHEGDMKYVRGVDSCDNEYMFLVENSKSSLVRAHFAIEYNDGSIDKMHTLTIEKRASDSQIEDAFIELHSVLIDNMLYY